MPEQTTFERLRFAIAPTFLLCANLALFGTFTVFAGNSGEFLVSYREALAWLLLPTSVTFIGLALLALLLGPNRGQFFNAFLIFLATVTYIHGSVLLWDTGVLDGAALDHAKWWRSLVDGVIWAVLAGLALRYRQWLALHGWILCAILLTFQTIGIAMHFDQLSRTSRGTMVLPDQLPLFSTEKNVIHIILDAFQANVFEQLLNENPQLAEKFSGFTFFRDALTPSDVTYLSIPATLSGKAFTNETTITEYHQQTLAGTNLYTFLASKNFSVDVASPLWWNQYNPLFTSYYRIPAPYTDLEDAKLSAALLLMDISVYRQLPHFLKAIHYNRGNWQLSSHLMASPELQFEHFAHNAFLRDFIARMTDGAKQPKYKFIHLVTPHSPLVSEADCSFSGAELKYSMSTFAAQSSCTMNNVIEFMQKLRELGLYDRSLIIIHSDHGGGVAFNMRDAKGNSTTSGQALNGVWGNPLPLILVKPSGAGGRLEISETPVSLLDIPVTVADLLKTDSPFPGASMYDPDRPVAAERIYYRSNMHRNDAAAKDRFDDFSSITVTGSVYDVSAWSDEKRFERADVSPYSWGTTLSFGRMGTFKPFQNGGWSISNSNDVTWTDGVHAGLSIPFTPTDTDLLMKVTLKPFLVPGKLDQQNVSVVVGNQRLTQWRLTENRYQTRELILPANLVNRDGDTEIDFMMPDARVPKSLGKGSDVRVLGLSFKSLQVDRIPTD